MSNQADIRDIQILGDLKTAFGRFGEDVLQVLAALEKQFEEIQEQLEQRQEHWQRQVDAAQEAVYEARRSLNECESEPDDEEGNSPDCSSEAERVSDAERDLAGYEDNLETVKQWRHRIESQIADFQNDMHRLSNLASSRTSSVQAFLANKIEILERYVGGVSSAVGVSGLRSQSGNDKISSGKLTERKSPVSNALNLKVDKDLSPQLAAAIASIDEVHDDGNLPSIPVYQNDEMKVRGSFEFQFQELTTGLVANQIAIRKTGSWPEFTMIHETAHFIDLEALGAKGCFATESGDPDMKNVLDVAKKSPPIKYLEGKLRETAAGTKGEGYLKYVLDDREIWARAYVQFVAERSTSKKLQLQLESAFASDPSRQWTKSDFVPIAHAIEQMFKKLKWL